MGISSRVRALFRDLGNRLKRVDIIHKIIMFLDALGYFFRSTRICSTHVWRNLAACPAINSNEPHAFLRLLDSLLLRTKLDTEF